MVQVHLGPYGGLAQMGERLLCTQEVTGSIPISSIGNVSYHMLHIENWIVNTDD